MSLTFQSWLSMQNHRQDDIGNLARFVAKIDDDHMPGRKRADEHKKWADIISWQNKPEYVFSFNRAWQEYEHIKSDED